jgi:hypothetical protein
MEFSRIDLRNCHELKDPWLMHFQLSAQNSAVELDLTNCFKLTGMTLLWVVWRKRKLMATQIMDLLSFLRPGT